MDDAPSPVLWAAATQSELACARRALKADEALLAELTPWLWALPGPDGNRAYFLLTGVGPVAAATAAALALARLGCEKRPAVGICNLGLAGTYDLDLSLGAVVIADSESWPEFGLRQPDGRHDARALGFSQEPAVPGFARVWNRLELDPAAQAERLGLRLPEGVIGGSVTVAGIREYPETAMPGLAAVMENMEGFGLAYACAMAGAPFLELRAISNRAGERDKAWWDIPAALKSLELAVSAMVL